MASDLHPLRTADLERPRRLSGVGRTPGDDVRHGARARRVAPELGRDGAEPRGPRSGAGAGPPRIRAVAPGAHGTGLMDCAARCRDSSMRSATGPVIVAGNSMGGALGFLQAAVEPSVDAGAHRDLVGIPWARGGGPHPPSSGRSRCTARGGWASGSWRRRRPSTRRPWCGSPPPTVASIRARLPQDVVRLLVGAAARDPGRPRSMPVLPGGGTIDLRLGPRSGRRPASHGRRAEPGTGDPRAAGPPRAGRVRRGRPAQHPGWRGRILPALGHVPHMEAPARWLTEVAEWHAATSTSSTGGAPVLLAAAASRSSSRARSHAPGRRCPSGRPSPR